METVWLLARMRFPKSSCIDRASRANQEWMKKRGAAIESAWSFNARALHRHFLLFFFYVHFRQWLVGLIGSALSGKLALVFFGFVHSEKNGEVFLLLLFLFG